MLITAIILIILAVLAYAWVIYPLLVTALASRKRAALAVGRLESAGERRVAVVLAAHNEEKVIHKRIENLLAGSTKMDRICLGLDACTDRTAEIARKFASVHPEVDVNDFSERQGKASVLKKIVERWTLDVGREGRRVVERSTSNVERGERRVVESVKSTDERDKDGKVVSSTSHSPSSDIFIFTDANTMFDEHAVEKLLAHFDDPKVGGVCGRLIFVGAKANEPDGSREDRGENRGKESDEGIYWEWETRLKTAESSLDSCLGANGAVYAIRASLFPADLPGNTVVDDFVIGMKVRERGYRMVYEPEAVAYEEAAPGMDVEWTRRVRIGSGDFQSLVLCRHCLLPRYGTFAWMFWSHKVLRWFTPHLILLAVTLAFAAAFATGGRGIEEAVGVAVSGASLLFLGCALAGRLPGSLRLFRLSSYFLAMQAALFVGFFRFCMGGLSGAWTRTSRE